MAKYYRSELVGTFGNPIDQNPTGVVMEAGFRKRYGRLSSGLTKQNRNATVKERFFGRRNHHETFRSQQGSS